MKKERLAAIFEQIFDRTPQIAVFAPGRVNLIGEHTDYNDGFVLPVAIDRSIGIIASRNNHNYIRAYSVDFGEDTEFELDSIEKSEDLPWSNYLRGVLVEYQKRGEELEGMDLIISGDIPIGSGLSSSAAFEVAVGEAVREVARADDEPGANDRRSTGEVPLRRLLAAHQKHPAGTRHHSAHHQPSCPCGGARCHARPGVQRSR